MENSVIERYVIFCVKTITVCNHKQVLFIILCYMLDFESCKEIGVTKTFHNITVTNNKNYRNTLLYFLYNEDVK